MQSSGSFGGPPVLLAATADIEVVHPISNSGTITVTFDRAVRLGPADHAPMYLNVYAADKACGIPAGNSHYVISGAGTPTLTLDATSLTSPATFISLAPGFVTSVESGTPNEPVGCTAVATS